MNCKPGDLAYIVKSVMPENIGRIVEVERAFPSAEPGLPEWEVRSTGAPLMAMYRITDTPFQTWDGVISDCSLRPISGVPVHDEVTNEVTA